MISILILCMAMEGGSVVYENTGLYKPISRGDVTVSASGHVYIVDFDEARILHYDSKGNRLADIGKKGQGPGEFQNPTKAWWQNEKLYVMDMGASKINVFDSNGVFEKSYQLPGMGTDVSRVDGGWIMGNWMFSMNPEAPIEIKLASEDFSEVRTIVEYPRPETEGGFRVSMGNGQVPKMKYNPAIDRNRMAVSPDGKWAFLSHPGRLKVDVIDIEQGRVTHNISREVNLIPFNDDWGKNEMARFKENRGAMRFELEANFPANFPIIRDLYVGAGNLLVISRFSGDPDKNQLAMVLDRQGRDARTPYLPENEGRIMAVLGNEALVSTFDDEEAGLIRVPFVSVDQVVSEHPIVFDGFAGRIIMKGG